jgi:hypothetical protein
MAILCALGVLPISVFFLLAASRSLLKGEATALAELKDVESQFVDEETLALSEPRLTHP